MADYFRLFSVVSLKKLSRITNGINSDEPVSLAQNNSTID
jgi:hypothetical protein